RLPDIIRMAESDVPLPDCLKNRYVDDPFFKIVLANPNDYKNFETSDGLIFLKNRDSRTLCIPDIRIGHRHIREIIISHAHSILAHLGVRKTLHYLRDNVWWK
ncbi:hypothetical protein K439DRAFT_1304471, partial [Ramaria rubella]